MVGWVFGTCPGDRTAGKKLPRSRRRLTTEGIYQMLVQNAQVDLPDLNGGEYLI